MLSVTMVLAFTGQDKSRAVWRYRRACRGNCGSKKKLRNERVEPVIYPG